VRLAPRAQAGYQRAVVTKEIAPASPGGTPATVGGFQKKSLLILALVVGGVWALAISTGSIIFMSIVGVLTAVVLGVLIWALRFASKQKKLASLVQGAVASPEARREALAKLEASKDSGDVTNVFVRAQLLSAEDPGKALEVLEAMEWKKVPAQMQDDVAILRSQLYLHFGRPKDARPFADLINVDNPQRKDARTVMVAIVAETWARTGKHTEALAMLDTVDVDAADDQARPQLLIARVFARFAAGKRGPAKEDLKAICGVDVNHLGRFLMPQFKVHPDLQRLAREVAEKDPTVRRMQKAQQRPQRGGGRQR
jgi:hypothetical protein